MNSLKNLTALFLAVLMLASVAVIGVSAETSETAFDVTAKSNLGESSVNSYDSAVDSEVVVNFRLSAEDLVANCQGYIEYDGSALEVKSFELSSQLPNPVYNTEQPNIIKFNSTSEENAGNFQDGASFAMVTFKILAAKSTDVKLVVEELNSLDAEYNRVALVTDGTVSAGKSVSAAASYEPDPEPTDPTSDSSETTATSSSETTATESSETQATTPTQAPATTIKVSAAKKTIYVNASTTVKATVTNAVGATKFKSSNTKVATVNSAGKVTGKKAGSVTITATNNGKSASVKIKVVKRANPMTVKAKTIKASSKNTKSFSKTKAFTVKKAKGTVVFKKTKGSKKVTVSSKGKVTVKKGLKKGTYKVTVKVTAKGNTAYKAKSKKVTLKVVVK